MKSPAARYCVRAMMILLMIIVSQLGCGVDKGRNQSPVNTPKNISGIEKDSIVHQLISSVKFINEIDDSLSSISFRIQAPHSDERKIKTYQEELREKLSEIAQRLRNYKGEIEKLSYSNSKYASQITELKKSLILREERIVRYKEMIGGLRSELKEKERELSRILNRLKSEVQARQLLKARLEEDISCLKEEYDLLKFTAYYVYGTEEQLEKRGLVKYSGGIFLFGLGRTPVPSFFDTTAEFTKIDIRKTPVIVLDSEIKKIITPQNQNYCQIEGNVLRINQPVQFWRGSRYLFIVTK